MTVRKVPTVLLSALLAACGGSAPVAAAPATASPQSSVWATPVPTAARPSTVPTPESPKAVYDQSLVSMRAGLKGFTIVSRLTGQARTGQTVTNVDRTDELTVTAARLSGGYQYINLGNPLGDLREAPCGTSSCYVLNYEESGDPLKTAEVLIDKQTFYLVRRTIVTKWSQGEVLTDVSTLKDLLPR